MSILRWLVIGWLVFSFASLEAYADPLAKPANADAREHLQQGNRNYNIHQFEKAIDEYKAGALSEDAPVFLFNLGQCYRMLGKYQDALWHYERFLAKGQPEGELKEEVDGFIRELKSDLDRQTHPSKPTDVMPSTAVPPATSQPVDAWYVDTLGWVLAGTGAVAAVAGGYLLLDANSLDDQANAEDRQDARRQLHDRASSRRTAGVIAGVGGLGLLTAGIVKLAIHDRAPEQSVTVGFTGRGLFVAGRF